ncbi:sigma-70 family RNA polymerase sigma factor [Mycolicibacterium sp.]|uniref:RNA polymerase sigma factor n=1 Tax=Mycolicibacterium sp. TaxID=2320850 RepID=UPI0025DF9F68|nr:sigma-70 family RNA polymerase sigma factor [Mycolicibacterium sp.]
MTNTGGAGRAGAEAVTAAWRAESARLVAALARMTRDIELAEDVAQDALVAALEEWPERGIPANPAAWLMTAAKRRAIDHIRRAETLRRKTEEIGHRLEEVDMPDFAGQVDFIEDDVLRLMFLTCHPQLAPASRAALTLRLVSGLSTAEIARAFLVPEATMAQRISRAKKTLVGADMELPMGAERVARLDDVLAAIYLTFNEGYVATAGTDWTRPDLCFEAIRLARMVAAMVPDIPDSLGLQALVELQASRIPARVDRDGAPVLLDDQDRARWDHLLRRRGLQVLARAEKLAAAGAPVGTYFLQAAIAACHARATRSEDTDWQRVADLYDVLALAAPGPVVEVNRAVAHGRAYGAEAGLAVLDALGPDPLPRSPLPHAVRGDLLERLGQAAEASAAFTRAAELSTNEAERSLLSRRAESP